MVIWKATGRDRAFRCQILRRCEIPICRATNVDSPVIFSDLSSMNNTPRLHSADSSAHEADVVAPASVQPKAGARVPWTQHGVVKLLSQAGVLALFLGGGS